ncbi:MAG: HAMP domain-containing sensor histidine kinase [Gemmatimonadaceae bacterium]
MSLTKASNRLGLFALLLSVIVLSLFGSLIAADRALSRADREFVELDAHLAALVTERELRLKAERLTHFDTIPAPGTFESVWLFDMKGRVVHRLGSPQAAIDSTLLVALALEVTPTSWPRLRGVAGAGGGVLLAAPLMRRGQQLGIGVGLVPGSEILATLEDTAVDRPWLALRVRGEPVTTLGQRDAFETYLTAAAVVPLPGDPVEVEVAHAQIGRALRAILWMLGVAALVALLAALARERRHTAHLAGRTAELERLYQEVARSNRMKSEFLANVSHELRTPLNAVVGFVEMLREGVYGALSPRQALPVDRIAASATHLRQLVDRLLDIAKIAAGRLEIHSELLVLRPFVLNVASEMESLVSERGLALSIGVGPSLPRVRTDQTHLRQILINLIGNAVKHTPSGGILVRARLAGNGVSTNAADEGEPNIGAPPDPERQWIALQVSDTGVGIAQADWERIFDEFEQVNAGARTDSARRGTGLGLAISRRLARLLGGELTVVSEVGRGSVFTVWLPLDSTEPKAG